MSEGPRALSEQDNRGRRDGLGQTICRQNRWQTQTRQIGELKEYREDIECVLV